MARNADPLRTGKSRSHRDRKNGSAHEAWLRRKAEVNEARGSQKIEEVMPENDMTPLKVLRRRA